MQFHISSPRWQRKYHMLNLKLCTVSQVNRVVLSSLLTRHAVLEDRHVEPWPESGSLAAVRMDMYVRLDMYLGTLTSAHLVVKLCPKNLCVTNVAFLGLPSLPCVFWNSIEIFLEVLMAMVAQTSQVSTRALRSLLISPCCATTWHVDPLTTSV